MQDSLEYQLLKKLAENPNVPNANWPKNLASPWARSTTAYAPCGKGLVKMEDFRQQPDKTLFRYNLTPKDLEEKALVTSRFLKEKMTPSILITGGAGFIGSALVRHLIANTDFRVINVDKLTYAGHMESIAEIMSSPRHIFEKTDICDAHATARIFDRHLPDAVMHLAAESCVDRSVSSPHEFIHTNMVGTYTLLESARNYWNNLDAEKQKRFRFLHVSTDEVYGSLGPEGLFTEQSPYYPSSPYSATKAAADHLVRAWHRTYGLPVLITNCSNNYGPYQYPEKLIPRTILNALAQKPIPLYGNGENVRDWIHVEDHARALHTVLEKAEPGRTYNIGGRCEKKNIEAVTAICNILNEIKPAPGHQKSNTHYRPPTTDHRPLSTDHWQQTTDNRLPSTDYRLPTTDHLHPRPPRPRPTLRHRRHPHQPGIGLAASDII